MDQIKRSELYKELSKWEAAQFMNAMKDHWSHEDVEFDIKCTEEVKRIKEILKNDNISD